VDEPPNPVLKLQGQPHIVSAIGAAHLVDSRSLPVVTVLFDEC